MGVVVGPRFTPSRIARKVVTGSSVVQNAASKVIHAASKTAHEPIVLRGPSQQ